MSASGNGKQSNALLKSALGAGILDDAEAAALLKDAAIETCVLGDELTSRLQDGQTALILLSGKIRLLGKTGNGPEQTLTLLIPGDIVDAESLNHCRLIVSSDECMLCGVPSRELKQIEPLKRFWSGTREKMTQGPNAVVPAHSAETIRSVTLTSTQSLAAPALLQQISAYYRLSLPSLPASTLEELSGILDKNGFITQRSTMTWSQLLHGDFPFVLQDETGTCRWITGRKGNSLLEGTASASHRFMPDDLSKSQTYNVLHCRPKNEAGQNGPDFGLGWYLRLLSRRGFLSGQMIMASVLVQIFSLGLPIFYMVIFDRVFGRQNLSTLDIMSIGILLVLTVDVMVKHLRSYILAHQLEYVDKVTIETLLEKVFSLPLAKAKQELTRSFSERYNEFIKMNQAIISMLLVSSLDVLFSSIIVVVLLLLHWQLALLSLISIVPITLATFWSSPRVQQRSLDFSKDQRQCQLQLTEVLQSSETVKSLNADLPLRLKLSRLMEEGLERHFTARFDRVNGPQLQGFFAGLGSVVTLYFGAHEVLQGEISYGVYMAINMMSRNVVGSIQRLLQAIVQFQEATGTMMQFKTLFDETEADHARHGQLQLDHVDGRLKLVDVYFRYQPDTPWALNGLNLEIKPGEKIIMAGKSGAGKTTLVRLLQRLYDPATGMITLDHFNLSDMDEASLRRHIGVALQKPALFSGTVRENILLGKPDASTRELIEAVSMAQLEEVLLQIPGGLDGKLAPMGANLSGGQAAQIALARIFLLNPSILILDEALAALDPSTAGLIFNRIFGKYSHSTCLFITDYVPVHHRADRIVMLNEGQIVETGTYQELVQAKGYYYHLYSDRLQLPESMGVSG